MADPSFPEFITARRRALELTLGDVASDIGVSPITVSNWSNGQSVPKKDNLMALAGVLGLPPYELADMAGIELDPPPDLEPEPQPEPAMVMETVEPAAVTERADEPGDIQEEAATAFDLIADPPEAAIPRVEHPTLDAPEAMPSDADSGVEVEADEAIGDEESSPAKVAPGAPAAPKVSTPPPGPESTPDVIPRIAASAPTTTQLTPLTYVQDPKQLLRYRIRWGITAVALVIMAFVLFWALAGLIDALGDVKESVTP